MAMKKFNEALMIAYLYCSSLTRMDILLDRHIKFLFS